MNDRDKTGPRRVRGKSAAFTLHEVVFSMGITAIAMAGLISGHNLSTQRALWSTFSQAAQSLAFQRMEQTRAARWDPYATTPVDELIAANFPPQVEELDVPVVGNNVVRGTNTTTITSLQSSPTAPYLRVVRVDCTWGFFGRGPFTNSMISYRTPNQ